MPLVILLAAGWPQEKLALMEFQQLAKQIVGETDVSPMIDEPCENRIAFNNVLHPQIPAFGILRMLRRHPVDGGNIGIDFFLGKCILNEDDAIFVKRFPLLGGEPRWCNTIVVFHSQLLYRY